MQKWLGKAYAEKVGTLQYLKTVHSLDALRPDPRFVSLQKRMGKIADPDIPIWKDAKEYAKL